jgi:hypothetical protein
MATSVFGDRHTETITIENARPATHEPTRFDLIATEVSQPTRQRVNSVSKRDAVLCPWRVPEAKREQGSVR